MTTSFQARVGLTDATVDLVVGMLASFIAACAVFWAWAGHAAAQDLDAKFAKHARGSAQTVDHSAWNGLLGSYVVAGEDGLNRVNYAAFKAKGHKDLKEYVAALEKVDPRTLDRAEQFAFWANLYNAKTIDIVLDHYPVSSIRKISLKGGLLDFFKKSVGAGGPWKTPVVSVAGSKLSLDNIEHDILRPVFNDPRVHYAVNCASIGCPNLAVEALTGAKLEAQLDAGAKAYINHPRGIRIADGVVEVSSIYNWFKADFGGDDAGVLEHARKYANPKLAKALKGVQSIGGHAYDWALNDTKK